MNNRDHYSKFCDVLVAGGGIAGVASALASARMGLHTILVEKTIILGGLATSGLILVYLPLSDNKGNQVTFGIAEELLHASIKYGPGDIPSDWKNPETQSRYMVWFSPASFALALDKLLIDSGVEIWLDTLICDSVTKDEHIIGVEIENKSGRGFIGAKSIIDATGDADVVFRAGAPCIEKDNWLSIWAIEASLDIAQKSVSEKSGSALNKLRSLGGSDVGIGAPDGIRKYYGTKGKDVTEFVLEGRKLLREFYEKEQKRLNRKDIFPITLPSMAQFRTTRRIDGIKTISNGDEFKHFDDCVGMVADWRDGKNIWEIPYYTLVPKGIKGILTAGRCISANDEAWQVMRVIQASAHTGEVAGVASAMSVKLDTTPDKLDIRMLQKELLLRDFLLNINKLDNHEDRSKT